MEYNRFDTPVFHTFRNGNPFTGSVGEMRYRMEPRIDRNAPENDRLLAFAWFEDVCFELSEPRERAEFPMEPGGLDDALLWLEGIYQQYIEANQH